MSETTKSLTLETVYFADPMGKPRPNMRTFARVGSKRYEFVRLDADSQIEVYDFPPSWGGLARFVGYASKETGAKLVTLAKNAIERVSFSFNRYGREHTVNV